MDNVDNDCKYLICASFEGLLISSKSSLHKTSMSKIWNTGVKSETGVKRMVKIQKSAPFTPGGRPDSLLYDTVYESEEIDEGGAVLRPSLIAVLDNPSDKDCKVRINVYYSSSLAREPLIMASTSFSLRDFLRSKKAVYSSVMGSEHCVAPVAHVRLLDKLCEPLSMAAVSCRADSKDWNPLQQKYVFQREEGQPPCFCEELTAEARLSFQVPLLFLKNFASVLSETIVAWTKRAHLERMRAGNFSSREEAYANGWIEVSIAVSSCSLIATRVELESSTFNDMWSGGTGAGSGSAGGLGAGAGSEQSAREEREALRPSCFVNVSLEDRNRVFQTPVGRTNTEYNTLDPCFGRNRNINLVKAKNRNTAEYRVHPSVQGNSVRLASLDVVQDTETSPDGEYEVVSTRLADGETGAANRRSSRKMSRSSGVLVLPKNTAFQVYVPCVRGARVCFEVEVEDVGSGKSALLGGCSFSLEDTGAGPLGRLAAPDVKRLFSQRHIVLPLQVVNQEACPLWQVHSGSISVAISLNQHPAGQAPDLPPLSPLVPHTRTANFVNDSVLSSMRNHQHDALRGPLPPPVPPSEECDESTTTGGDTAAAAASAELTPPLSLAEILPEAKMSMRRRSLIQRAAGQYNSDDEGGGEVTAVMEDVLATPPSSPLGSPAHSLYQAAASDETLAVPIINMRRDDTSQLMTDCYEFMWHLGFKGEDPLLLEDVLPTGTRVHSTSSTSGAAALLQVVHEEDSLSHSDEDSLDQPPPAPAPAPSTHEEDATDPSLNERVDISYSQEFLWDYVFKLQNMFSHLLMLISACEAEVGEGNTFRPSRLKKEVDFQPLPINFHYQVMALQYCGAADRVKDPQSAAGFWVNPPNKHPTLVWDSVTCGSFSAHACPHNQGGLTKLLSQVGSDKDALSRHKAEYHAKVLQHREGGGRTRSVGSGFGRASGHPWASAFSATGLEANRRAALVNEAENFETSVLNTVLRRMYCVSQALSVAVNSFIMKLELVVEGHVHASLLDRWFTHGFLLVHECLLSVSGKERTMIEDSWLAIETLKSFTIRLLPSPHDEQYRTSNSWLAQNCSSSGARKIQSSTWWHSLCGGEGGAARADVHIVGREVQVFVPRSVVEALQGGVQAAVEAHGAVFSLVPVLFSQGIDIMQSIATTWDSATDGIGDFQLHINVRGFERLNSYCQSIQPCSVAGEGSTSFHSKAFVPHPLTAQLLNLVRTTDASAKNVQMLIEMERICSIVGGCRVTFCKSGKDRTGMAITLEQSRLLGEVCGSGTSDERILRDADVMRVHGTRIMIAEKNIGRPVYSINMLQVKFLPLFYRPPFSVTEKMIKSGDNS